MYSGRLLIFDVCAYEKCFIPINLEMLYHNIVCKLEFCGVARIHSKCATIRSDKHGPISQLNSCYVADLCAYPSDVVALFTRLFCY